VHILVDSTGLQVYGAGQWLEEKHGARWRRGWRKLHVALDADSSEIIAHTMTDQDAGDASQVEPLLNQIDGRIGQFTADGAYDGKPTYDAVTDHSAAAVIVIPPRANAIEPAGDQSPGQRDQHIAAISRDGRRLRARSFHAQQTEVAIGCAALNRMLACARPKSIRRNGPTT